MNKFFIELPRDEYGNRSYTNFIPAILEIQSVLDGSLEVNIIAPEYHAERFKTIPEKDMNENWIEVDGPARMVSEREREVIIINALRRNP